MKKIFWLATPLCILYLSVAPVFGQDVYTLPTPQIAANFIAAMKAQARTFPGIQVEASTFVPGTTIPNNIVEVVFRFEKPEGEGGGIFAPWLVAIFPLDQDSLIADFVVVKRFSADYDRHAGFKGDPRVYDRLKEFLDAVFARLGEPQMP